MARTVYLHVGLPKTATTYLQTILWNHREVLAAQGVVLPGRARKEHYWASRIVREDAQFAAVSGRRRLAAWDRLRADVEQAPDAAVISHEFFAAATTEQAARMVADLAPAEVHLVVTARDPLGLFCASWQESIKNRDVRTMAEYGHDEDDPEHPVWSWWALDVRRVLERWSPAFAPERVHVLPLSPRAPHRQVWDRFASVIGVDPDSVDLSASFPNTSMGVVEAETLRRVNAHLEDFNTAIERGTYIRTFLADDRLVPRGGERFWPVPERVAEIRERGRRAAAYVASSGFHVLGEVEDLLVPEDLPERRVPESVTDAEVAEVAVELVARMLHDVRALRHERRDLRAALELSQAWEDPGLRVNLVRRWPSLRPLLLRGQPMPGVRPPREVPHGDASQAAP